MVLYSINLLGFTTETECVYCGLRAKSLTAFTLMIVFQVLNILHAHLQIIPIRQFIYHLTDKFFVSCPMHLNPLIRNTGNYTLEDLHRQYTKYKHKRIKHILL